MSRPSSPGKKKTTQLQKDLEKANDIIKSLQEKVENLEAQLAQAKCISIRAPDSDEVFECAKEDHFRRLKQELKDAYAKLEDAEKQNVELRQQTPKREMSLVQDLKEETIRVDKLVAENEALKRDLQLKEEALEKSKQQYLGAVDDMKHLMEHNAQLKQRIFQMSENKSAEISENVALKKELQLKEKAREEANQKYLDAVKDMKHMMEHSAQLKQRIALLSENKSAEISENVALKKELQLKEKAREEADQKYLNAVKDMSHMMEHNTRLKQRIRQQSESISGDSKKVKFEKEVVEEQQGIPETSKVASFGVKAGNAQSHSQQTTVASAPQLLLEDAKKKIKDLEAENKSLHLINAEYISKDKTVEKVDPDKIRSQLANLEPTYINPHLSPTEKESAMRSLKSLYLLLQEARNRVEELERENQRLLSQNGSGADDNTVRKILHQEMELNDQGRLTSYMEEQVKGLQQNKGKGSLEVRLEEALGRIKEIEAENKKLSEDGKQFKRRMAKELTDLHEVYSKEVRKVSIYEQQIKDAGEEIRRLSTVESNLKKEISALNTKIHQGDVDKNSSISAVEKELRAEISLLRSREVETAKAHERLIAEVRSWEGKGSKMAADGNELKLEIKQLKEAAEVSSRRFHNDLDSQVQHWKGKVDIMTKTEEDLRAEILILEKGKEKSSEVIDRLRKEVQGLQEKVSSMASVEQGLKADVAQLQARIQQQDVPGTADKEQRVVKRMPDDVASLKSDHGYFTDGESSTGHEFCRQEVEQLRGCLQMKTKLLDEMLERMKELELKNSELQSKLKQCSPKDLQANPGDIVPVHLTNLKLHSSWIENVDLREMLLAKTKQLDEAIKSLQELEKQHVDLIDNLKDLKSNEDPGFEEELYRRLSSNLQESLNHKSLRLQQAYEDMRSLDVHYVKAQNDLKKSDTTISNLKAEITKLKDSLDLEQSNAKRYQKDCLHLQNKILDSTLAICPSCVANGNIPAIETLQQLKNNLGIAILRGDGDEKDGGQDSSQLGLLHFNEALTRALSHFENHMSINKKPDSADAAAYGDMKGMINELKEAELKNRKLMRELQLDGEMKALMNEDECAHTQKKLDDAVSEVRSLKETVALMQEELRAKELQLVRLEEAKELLIVEVHGHKAVVRDLQGELEELATDYRAVQESLDDSRETIDRLETALSNEKQMLEIESTSLRAAKMEVARLMGQEEVSRIHAVNASLEPEQLKAQLDLEKNAAHSAKEELCNVRMELHRENQRMVDVMQQLVRSQQEVSKEKQQVKRQKDEVERYEKLVEELRTQLLAQTNDDTEVKKAALSRSNLEDKVMQLQKCIKDLEFKLTTSKDRNTSLQLELDSSKEDIEKIMEEFRDELRQLRELRQRDCEDLVKLQSDLLQANKEIMRYKSLSKHLNRSKWPASAYCKVHEVSSLVDRLKEEIFALKNRENDHISKLTTLEGEYEADQNMMKCKVDSLQKELETKNTEIDSLRLEIHSHRHKEDKLEELNKIKIDRVDQLEKEWYQQMAEPSLLSNQVKDREMTIDSLRQEIDSLHQSIRSLKEELATRDGELRVAKMNLQTAQKQTIHHSQEVSRYEETLTQLQGELEQSQDQYRNCHSQLMEQEKANQELKVQLTTVQGNNKESMDQLAEKSRQLASIRQELSRSQEQSQVLAQEVALHEDKMRRLRQELRKVQENNRASEEELQAYEARYRGLMGDLKSAEERGKMALQEVSVKEEEVMMMKIELQSTHDKLRLKANEVESLLKDGEVMKQKYESATEEITNLKVALEDSRVNSDRLHKESEQVVHNVNSWVEETKQTNERLGCKIREQSKAIVQLTAEKDHMVEQVDTMSKAKSELEIELDQRRVESERYKALQSHSSQQQMLLHQLRKRLEEHEADHEQEVNTKLATIEDLHQRLRGNIEIVQQLNDQLTALQKENMRFRGDMEREIAQRQSLRLQLDSKEQLINSLKVQLDNRLPSDATSATSPAYRGRGAESLVDSAYMSVRSARKYERARPTEEVTDPQAMDKTYWINRVGEALKGNQSLSSQLQQSSEYWSEKVRDLSTQLDRAKSTSPPSKSLSPSRPR